MVWFLHFVPPLEEAVKTVPMVPTSALLLLLCYAVAPRGLLKMNIRIRPAAWAIPYAIAGALSVVAALSPLRALKDSASDWFWLFLLFPLMVRVLSTPSGRRYCSMAVPAIALAYLAYWCVVAIGRGFSNELLLLDHADVGLTVVTAFPLCVGWVCRERRALHSGAWLACSAVMLWLAVPLGSRTAWIVLCAELILLFLFILPKRSRRTYVLVGLIGLAVLGCLPEAQPLGLYPIGARMRAQKRLAKLSDYPDDATFYTRVGCYAKAWEILKETSLLGAGLGNRNFTLAPVQRVSVFGREVDVRKRDAHSFYLSTLGEVGVLGFVAFLILFGNVLWRMLKLPGHCWRSPETGPFLISSVGVFIYLLAFTSCPMRLVYGLSFALGPYVHCRSEQAQCAAGKSAVGSDGPQR